MAAYFLPPGIFFYIFHTATSYENQPVCLYVLSSNDIRCLPFFSFTALPPSFFPPIPRPDFKHMLGMTDSVWRSIREEAKEGNHISSSAICTDSLSRLVLMKSHLSLACLDSISLSLIVLTLSLALSGPWWPCVCLSVCVCHSVYRSILLCLLLLYHHYNFILVLLAVSQIFFWCSPLKKNKKLFSKLLKRL